MISFLEWKIVCDVTENFRRQPEHFHRIGDSAKVYTLATPQCGQNGSPSLAANRTRWNVSKACLSVSLRT